MHDNRTILLSRLKRVWQERVAPAQTRRICDLSISRFDVTNGDSASGQGEPISLAEALEGEYHPAHIGDAWGPSWGTTWFRMGVEIPQDCCGSHLELVVDLGWKDYSPGFQSEGLVRDTKNHIIKALNPLNKWIPVDSMQSRVDVLIEAAANPILLDIIPFIPTDEGKKETSSTEPIYRLAEAALVVVDDEVRQLSYDLEALIGLVEQLSEDDARSWEILIGAGEALDLLDMTDISAGAPAAREKLAPLLSKKARPGVHELTAVGHAHIDSAWLWPIRETRRKVVRTLANVCRLLDDGSPMIFALPVAQHVAWLEEDAPDLFTRVKTYVAEEKIVPVGGMWVESDAVLPGGEALARQFVEGQSYFEERLGVTCRNVWLPDSFGYSGALPQIAHLAGLDRFLTQKISWNQIDRFPHHTLWWEGIDGTRIFTHFPPADTYGSDISARDLHHAEVNFKEKGHSNMSILPYGYGDGGGGPTREMFSRAERFADIDGLPRVVHDSPDAFFDRVYEEYGSDAPVWVGELYLELHRGTFTSQHATKQGNRRSESLLREAELWAATASWRTGASYPAQELRQCWHDMLLCQFHDILPGTSIAWVYEEVADLYQKVRQICERIIEESIQSLSAFSSADAIQGTAILNATSFPSILDGNGIPALGGTVTVDRGERQESSRPLATDDTLILDNGIVSARFDRGCVVSLKGEDGREVIPAGQRLGELHIAQDFPNQWDAWDIDEFYHGSLKVLDAPQVINSWSNTHGQFIQTEVSFGTSSARMTWSLAPGAQSLKIDVDVDWHEKEKLLKFTFPIDVHTDHAEFETQFGHIVRSTHENTSWDANRFEVSSHRWLRVSEPNWGVAIANDSTYGWDITRHARHDRGTWSLVRATLLKGSRYPDPHQDEGEQSFAFTIRPDANVKQAIVEAQLLNIAPRRIENVSLASQALSPIVECEGAVIESISLDPKTSDLLVRLYEPEGARSHVHICVAYAQTVRGVDLRYRDSDLGVTVTKESRGWSFDLSPFEIATLRVSK